MSQLCVLTAAFIFVPNLASTTSENVSVTTMLVFSLWAFTLLLIAVMVGTLSDQWRLSVAGLVAAHAKDVLTDPLTGVANRRAFEFELTRRLSERKRSHSQLSLILLDIDYFKKFNDRYGHQAGDAVLCAVAQVLKKTVRQSDLVVRYGGEEFGVILPGSKPDKAMDIAERIRSTIEFSRFPFNRLKLRLTVSVGVALAVSEEDLSSFVERADAALYSSKDAGRNCAHFHDGQSCHLFGNGIAIEIANPDNNDSQVAPHADPYTDETTGLPTQKVFLEELRRRVAETNRYGSETSIALVRIDQQPSTSEQDGHARKSLIATIAKLASSELRETELIARYDANSLAILMPQTTLQIAVVLLNRLSEISANYRDAKYSSLRYSVSIGATEVTASEQAGVTLHRAEAALNCVLDDPQISVGIHDGIECRTTLVSAQV